MSLNVVLPAIVHVPHPRGAIVESCQHAPAIGRKSQAADDVRTGRPERLLLSDGRLDQKEAIALPLARTGFHTLICAPAVFSLHPVENRGDSWELRLRLECQL